MVTDEPFKDWTLSKVSPAPPTTKAPPSLGLSQKWLSLSPGYLKLSMFLSLMVHSTL